MTIELNPQLKEKLQKEQAEEVINSNSFSNLSEVKVVVGYLQAKGTPLDVIVKTLKGFDWKFSYNISPAEIIEALALQKVDEKQILRGTFDNVVIYDDEREYLSLIDSEDERRLLFYFLVIAKWNNHPTWWVRYDRDAAFDFWNMKYNTKEREDIIKNCCNEGLELRVVGSKNPMICFNLFYRMPIGDEVAIIECEEDIKRVYEYLFHSARTSATLVVG